jgi:hypothetical protein
MNIIDVYKSFNELINVRNSLMIEQTTDIVHELLRKNICIVDKEDEMK